MSIDIANEKDNNIAEIFKGKIFINKEEDGRKMKAFKSLIIRPFSIESYKTDMPIPKLHADLDYNKIYSDIKQRRFFDLSRIRVERPSDIIIKFCFVYENKNLLFV